MSPPSSSERIGSKLDARRIEQRLSHLREFVEQDAAGVASTSRSDRIFCAVPTSYSVGAHSPSYIAFEARTSGLGAVGSMDELSIDASGELYEACKTVGIGSTFGFCLEVSFDAAPIKEILPSEPDGTTLSRIELYGVPFTSRDHIQQFLRPIQDARNARQRKQTGRLNKAISSLGLGSLEYDSEVLSATNSGGSVTDLHLMLALARRIVKRKKSEAELTAFLRESVGISLTDEHAQELVAAEGQSRAYRLAELLKERFIGEIALSPNRSECVSVADVVSFASEVGAIPCFRLADLPQDAETLQSLLDGLVQMRFAGISFAPADLSAEQVQQLHAAALERELLELPATSRYGGNESGQENLALPALSESEHGHLLRNSWALVAHQQLEACNPRLGLLAAGNPFFELTVPERAAKYAELGKQIEPANPESACEQLKESLM